MLTALGGPAGLGMWLLRVPSHTAAAELDLSLLDAVEHDRAAGMARPGDRLRFLAAHVALRQLLAERLGSAPGSLRFGRERCPQCGGPKGRPVVARPPCPLHFSLSYAGELALIAIAAMPVGIDLQALPSPRTVDEVAQLLAAPERRELQAAEAGQRAGRFARLWAREEAYLKAIGTGIAHGIGGRRRPGCSVADVPAPDGYCAAVAIRSSNAARPALAS